MIRYRWKIVCFQIIAMLLFSQDHVLSAPKIWFGAEPPLPLGSKNPTQGAYDYEEFLSSSDNWSEVSHYISGVKINAAWIEKVASDKQLTQIIGNLRDNNISIILELDALSASDKCRGAGFANRDRAEAVKKIIRLGGKVDFLVLNEPYAWGVVSAKCQMTAEDVASDIKPFIDELRSISSSTQIGDVEPLWQNINGRDLVSWSDTFASVTGYRFKFFDLDVDFHKRASDWDKEAKSISVKQHERGTLFGMQVFGDRSDQTDQQWLYSTEARIDRIHRLFNPDSMIIQSWHPIPHRLLPETDASTFTGFVLQYAISHRVERH